MKKIILVLAIVVAACIVIVSVRDRLGSLFFTPRQSSVEVGVTSRSVRTSDEKTSDMPDIEIFAENLSIPWDIAFLPEGGVLVTQRAGQLLKIDEQTQVIQQIERVRHEGEGGLLGITLDPNFSQNNFIYLYLTSTNQNGITNRVERYRFADNALSDRVVIIDEIQGAIYHDGGRIDFGPDGKLYITTGDAQNTSLAQDTSSLNGKILRINADGSIPDDNPFGNAIYSYGHRNPQGLAWDAEGNLWSTEHGPSGTQTGYDELNLIEKGANYGWPDIKGDQTREGMVSPVIQSGARDTWAPAGLMYHNNSLFIPGLRGESLYQATLSATEIEKFVAHFSSDYGRLRTVRMGHDGFFYITTSNRDGRGEPQENDDKIIKVSPEIFN